jgi:hypothetical protein
MESILAKARKSECSKPCKLLFENLISLELDESEWEECHYPNFKYIAKINFINKHLLCYRVEAIRVLSDLLNKCIDIEFKIEGEQDTAVTLKDWGQQAPEIKK